MIRKVKDDFLSVKEKLWRATEPADDLAVRQETHNRRWRKLGSEQFLISKVANRDKSKMCRNFEFILFSSTDSAIDDSAVLLGRKTADSGSLRRSVPKSDQSPQVETRPEPPHLSIACPSNHRRSFGGRLVVLSRSDEEILSRQISLCSSRYPISRLISR